MEAPPHRPPARPPSRGRPPLPPVERGRAAPRRGSTYRRAVPRPVPVRPAPGQESVWDYPRPPRVEPCTAELVIELGGHVVARTSSAWRVLETSHPPTYYLPRSAFVAGSLRAADGSSFCEWKGQAAYLDILGGADVA